MLWLATNMTVAHSQDLDFARLRISPKPFNKKSILRYGYQAAYTIKIVGDSALFFKGIPQKGDRGQFVGNILKHRGKRFFVADQTRHGKRTLEACDSCSQKNLVDVRISASPEHHLYRNVRGGYLGTCFDTVLRRNAFHEISLVVDWPIGGEDCDSIIIYPNGVIEKVGTRFFPLLGPPSSDYFPKQNYLGRYSIFLVVISPDEVPPGYRLVINPNLESLMKIRFLIDPNASLLALSSRFVSYARVRKSFKRNGMLFRWQVGNKGINDIFWSRVR